MDSSLIVTRCHNYEINYKFRYQCSLCYKVVSATRKAPVSRHLHLQHCPVSDRSSDAIRIRLISQSPSAINYCILCFVTSFLHLLPKKHFNTQISRNRMLLIQGIDVARVAGLWSVWAVSARFQQLSWPSKINKKEYPLWLRGRIGRNSTGSSRAGHVCEVCQGCRCFLHYSSLFVDLCPLRIKQEHYSTAKESNPATPHKDIMKILSQNFKLGNNVTPIESSCFTWKLGAKLGFNGSDNLWITYIYYWYAYKITVPWLYYE